MVKMLKIDFFVLLLKFQLFLFSIYADLILLTYLKFNYSRFCFHFQFFSLRVRTMFMCDLFRIE